MRKRFQNGRVVKSNDGRWIGKWRENGHDRSKVLGKVSSDVEIESSRGHGGYCEADQSKDGAEAITAMDRHHDEGIR